MGIRISHINKVWAINTKVIYPSGTKESSESGYMSKKATTHTQENCIFQIYRTANFAQICVSSKIKYLIIKTFLF